MDLCHPCSVVKSSQGEWGHYKGFLNVCIVIGMCSSSFLRKEISLTSFWLVLESVLENGAAGNRPSSLATAFLLVFGVLCYRPLLSPGSTKPSISCNSCSVPRLVGYFCQVCVMGGLRLSPTSG